MTNERRDYIHPGAHLRVIAPASSTEAWDKFSYAVQAFTALGFRISFGKNLKKRKGFLAGTDAERLADLHAAFADTSVDGIICLRGGYGTTRLLSKLDYNLIRQNKKPVLGFSDITALQLALYKHADIISYSSPNFLSFCTDSNPKSASKKKKSYSLNEFNIRAFIRAAFQQPGRIDLLDLPKKYLSSIVTLNKPKASSIRGTLIGGNLMVLCSLLGTPHFPNLKGKILFLEEVQEAPYRFDRLLTQLIDSGSLKGVKAIVIGQCHGCTDWQAIVKERLTSTGVPLLIGLPFGHLADLITMPIGRPATIGFGKKISLHL